MTIQLTQLRQVSYQWSKTVKRHCGMSLLELLIVIAMISILTVIAVPQYHAMVMDTRISSNVNEFLAANAFARAEAIKRGRLVTICRAVGADTGTDACSQASTANHKGDDWGTGWLVFVEGSSKTSDIGTFGKDDEILSRQGELSAYTEGSSTGSKITYSPLGEPINMHGANVKFFYKGDFRRVLCIARTGRIRVVYDADTCSG